MEAVNERRTTKLCKNCGNEIPLNTQYCPVCGFAQYGNSQPKSQSNTRDNTLNQLHHLHDYFSQKQAEYDEVDRLALLLPQIDHVRLKWMLIVGIILMISSFLYFAVNVPEAGVPIFFIGGGLICAFIVKEDNRKKRLQSSKDRIDELMGTLMEHYQQYGDCPLDISATYPQNIAELYDLVQSGRADTLKEALNIQINDARMDEMAQMANAAVQNSAQAARAARTSSVLSGISAGLNVYNTFKK